MERDFKGIWIPKEIWLSDLSLLEKVMLVEINSLDNENGCYAGNEYFAEFFGITTIRVSQVIKELKDKGFIEQVSFDGRKRVLKSSLKENFKADLNSFDGSLKENFKAGLKYSISQPDRKLESSHKENDKHNNTISNSSNNSENNKIKNSHISIFNNLYLAKDFGIPQSLIDEQEKINWNNICEDAVYVLLDFVKYRKVTKQKPVKTALMMNNILDTVRGKTEKEIYSDCLKAMGSGGGWLLPNYDHLNKQEKKDKFVEGLNNIK